MNVVVIVLSNYISSRNREMLTTTNERGTVIIIIKQNKESSRLKALSLARSSAFLFFLSLSQSLSSSLLTKRSSVCRKDTPIKRFKSARQKTDVFPLFFSAFLKFRVYMRP